MTINKDITSENVNELFTELFEMQQTGKYFFRGIKNDDELLPSLF